MDTIRLRSDHTLTLDAASRLSGMASRIKTRDDAEEVRAAIDGMHGSLVVHLSIEDTLVYPVLMEAQDLMLRALARDTFANMGLMLGAWISYRELWPVERILSELDGFTQATNAITGAIAMRIAIENHVLYPAADKVPTLWL